MLALTRKKGESLVINNNIEVTILEIRGDQRCIHLSKRSILADTGREQGGIRDK